MQAWRGRRIVVNDWLAAVGAGGIAALWCRALDHGLEVDGVLGIAVARLERVALRKRVPAAACLAICRRADLGHKAGHEVGHHLLQQRLEGWRAREYDGDVDLDFGPDNQGPEFPYCAWLADAPLLDLSETLCRPELSYSWDLDVAQVVG